MTKAKPSILRRMVIGQLLIVALFSIVTAVNLLWEFKKDDSGSEINSDLRLSAQAIANTIHPGIESVEQMQTKAEAFNLLIHENLSVYKKERLSIDTEDLVGIHISLIDGKEIFRSKNFPVEHANATQTASASTQHQGHTWRQYTLRDEQRGLIVQYAQNAMPLDENLSQLIQKFILFPLLWFLPLAALVTYFSTTRGLLPLRSLAKSIALRTPNDMNAIEHPKAYAETEPVVNAINALLLKLEITLARERHFLADAAHELRTPLAVIQAQAYVLQQAENGVEKTVALNELNAGIERAASLIQKLMLNARVSVDSYIPDLQKVELCAFVQERMATISVLAAKKEIEMELFAPPACHVQFDRDTFISALDNVLDNAIRYTPEGGRIDVTIEMVKGTHQVALRVIDSGVGIPSELHDRVFERFYRVAGNEQSGSGLGLAIVKRVLAIHGGAVTMAPGLNQRGLAVSLMLPLMPEAA
jgi:signal transduction histidine kinase